MRGVLYCVSSAPDPGYETWCIIRREKETLRCVMSPRGQPHGSRPCLLDSTWGSQEHAAGPRSFVSLAQVRTRRLRVAGTYSTVVVQGRVSPVRPEETVNGPSACQLPTYRRYMCTTFEPGQWEAPYAGSRKMSSW